MSREMEAITVAFKRGYAAGLAAAGAGIEDDHQVCDEHLGEAIDLVEEWAGYASDYFKEKWDLAGDLARLRSYLIAPPTPPLAPTSVASEHAPEPEENP